MSNPVYVISSYIMDENEDPIPVDLLWRMKCFVATLLLKKKGSIVGMTVIV